MITIVVQAEMPDELLQDYLQHLRDFDMQHDPDRDGLVNLNIGVQAPDLPVGAVERIFRNIRPPFDSAIFPQGTGQA